MWHKKNLPVTIKTLTHCRICGTSKFTSLLDYRCHSVDGSYSSEKTLPLKLKKTPLTLAMCKNCGFLQLKQIVSNQIYEEYNFSSKNTQRIVDWMEKISSDLTRKYHLHKKNLLEIGSGDGSFISYFKNNHLLSIEPSKKLCRLAEKKGVKVLNRYFNCAMSKKLSKQDVIFVRHVLEHIDRLKDFVAGIAHLRKKDGIIYIEAPYAPSIIKGNNYFNIFYEHINYFTLRDIKKLFDPYGISIIEYGFNKIHNGSFFAVLSAKKRGQAKKIDDVISQKNICLFMENFRKYKNKLLKIHALIKSKKTAGYGAANKTFAILNAGNFTVHEIMEIYDKNALLQGKYIPYFNIPIAPPAQILQTNPEYVIIFATAYQDEIINDLNKLGYQGKIILLTPKLKIIKNNNYED